MSPTHSLIKKKKNKKKKEAQPPLILTWSSSASFLLILERQSEKEKPMSTKGSEAHVESWSVEKAPGAGVPRGWAALPRGRLILGTAAWVTEAHPAALWVRPCMGRADRTWDRGPGQSAGRAAPRPEQQCRPPWALEGVDGGRRRSWRGRTGREPSRRRRRAPPWTPSHALYHTHCPLRVP